MEPELSPEYLDHFANPRCLGVLEACTHRASGTVPPGTGCFDSLELTARVEQGVINEIRFRGRLCSGSIVASSMLCSLSIGKRLEEWSNNLSSYRLQLQSFIPQHKEHAISLVFDTMQRCLFDSNTRS